MSEYTYTIRLQPGFDKAVARVTDALSEEGFGVLSDIDVAETLQRKLGEPFHAYRILGACNPRLAYEAIKLDDSIGALLPCNVVVQETGDGVRVDIARPDVMVRVTDSQALEGVMGDADMRLRRVVERLEGDVPGENFDNPARRRIDRNERQQDRS